MNEMRNEDVRCLLTNKVLCCFLFLQDCDMPAHLPTLCVRSFWGSIY